MPSLREVRADDAGSCWSRRRRRRRRSRRALEGSATTDVTSHARPRRPRARRRGPSGSVTRVAGRRRAARRRGRCSCRRTPSTGSAPTASEGARERLTELKGRDRRASRSRCSFADVDTLLELRARAARRGACSRAMLPGPFTIVGRTARRFVAPACPETIGVRVPAAGADVGRSRGRRGARDEREPPRRPGPAPARGRAGARSAPRCGAALDGGELPGVAVDGGRPHRRGAARAPRGRGAAAEVLARARLAGAAVRSGRWRSPRQTFEQLRSAGLASVDPEIAALLGRELERQRSQIELIASENFTWPSVLEAIGSVPTNKYAEGYPGRRYYGGCEVVDEIEQAAIDRAKALFGADHANVQPHAGAQTNMAVYIGGARPGRHDPLAPARPRRPPDARPEGQLLGPPLHDRPLRRRPARRTSSTTRTSCRSRSQHRPKLIVCGGSAYPRTVEADKFRAIADEVGALLLCDMAHFAGLVAAGLHPSPVPHCDFVTSTTHKTLAGPRSGFILCKEEHATAVDRAVFPGMQGGPLVHAIAAKATCFRIAATEAFRDYQQQIRANADALAEALLEGGLDLLTGGTDTHLLQVDLRSTEWTGKDAEERLDEVKLTVNRNTVPVRRAAADRRFRHPHRHAGRDDARLRRGGLPRGRADHRRRARRGRRHRRARAHAARRCARSGRSTRATAATPTLRRRMSEAAVTTGRSRTSRIRSSSTSSRTSATSDTPTVHFRKLVNELTLLLTYEATKDFADGDGEIETPLERMDAQRISGKKVAVCPVLRAGVGMLDGVLSLDLERARRLHRHVPRRGDARAGRVLREAARRPRGARRDRPRPDARDRELERGGDRGREGRGRAVGHARLASSPRRRASSASTPRIRTSTSSAPPSTAG